MGVSALRQPSRQINPNIYIRVIFHRWETHILCLLSFVPLSSPSLTYSSSSLLGHGSLAQYPALLMETAPAPPCCPVFHYQQLVLVYGLIRRPTQIMPLLCQCIFTTPSCWSASTLAGLAAVCSPNFPTLTPKQNHTVHSFFLESPLHYTPNTAEHSSLLLFHPTWRVLKIKYFFWMQVWICFKKKCNAMENCNPSP